jgi:hypothetical protein
MPAGSVLLGCYFARWGLCLGIYYVVFGGVRMSDISMRRDLLNAKIRIAELDQEVSEQVSKRDVAESQNKDLVARLFELEQERDVLFCCLTNISNQCIGEITMAYRLDAEFIGRQIYAATEKTNAELNEQAKTLGEQK